MMVYGNDGVFMMIYDGWQWMMMNDDDDDHHQYGN